MEDVEKTIDSKSTGKDLSTALTVLNWYAAARIRPPVVEIVRRRGFLYPRAHNSIEAVPGCKRKETGVTFVSESMDLVRFLDCANARA